ncbi:hypothetical protein ACVIJ6_003995 [Bradyrhizobium sp. USDA 4369]
MMSFGFLNLKGIRGQITALVAISIVALHAIITATFLIYRAEQPEGESEAGPFQLATAIRILGRAPAGDRPRLMADIVRAYPGVRHQTSFRSAAERARTSARAGRRRRAERGRTRLRTPPRT